MEAILKRATVDPRLSARAQGVLAKLIVHPELQSKAAGSLMPLSDDGRDSIYNALKELQEGGYVVKEQTKAENGRMTGIRYRVVDNEE